MSVEVGTCPLSDYKLARSWMEEGVWASCLSKNELTLIRNAIESPHTWQDFIHATGKETTLLHADQVAALRLLVSRLLTEEKCGTLTTGRLHQERSCFQPFILTVDEHEAEDWSLANQTAIHANVKSEGGKVKEGSLSPMDTATSQPLVPSLEQFATNKEDVETRAVLVYLMGQAPPPGLEPPHWIALSCQGSLFHNNTTFLDGLRQFLAEYCEAFPGSATRLYVKELESMAIRHLKGRDSLDNDTYPAIQLDPFPSVEAERLRHPSLHSRHSRYAERMTRLATCHIRCKTPFSCRPSLISYGPHCEAGLKGFIDSYDHSSTGIRKEMESTLSAPSTISYGGLEEYGVPKEWMDMVMDTWQQLQTAQRLRTSLVQRMIDDSMVEKKVEKIPSVDSSNKKLSSNECYNGPGLIHPAGEAESVGFSTILLKGLAGILTQVGFQGAGQEALTVLVEVAQQLYERLGQSLAVAMQGNPNPDLTGLVVGVLDAVAGASVVELEAFYTDVCDQKQRLAVLNKQLAAQLAEGGSQGPGGKIDDFGDNDVALLSGNFGVDLGMDVLGLHELGVTSSLMPTSMANSMDLDGSQPYCTDSTVAAGGLDRLPYNGKGSSKDNKKHSKKKPTLKLQFKAGEDQ